MVNFVKILISMLKPKNNKISVKVINNEDLVNLLKDISYDERYNEVIDTPVGKMCLMNTYTSTFNDLLGSLTKKQVIRNIVAVNVKSYFNNSTLSFTETIKRIIPIVEQEKLSSTIIHDFYEVIDTLKYLVNLEGEHHE